MRTLRFIAAALMALGLSAGAAMAEGERRPAKARHAPSGVCLLGPATR